MDSSSTTTKVLAASAVTATLLTALYLHEHPEILQKCSDYIQSFVANCPFTNDDWDSKKTKNGKDGNNQSDLKGGIKVHNKGNPNRLVPVNRAQKETLGSPILVAFGSIRGSTEEWAVAAAEFLSKKYTDQIDLACMGDIDLEDIVDNSYGHCFLFLATDQDGTPPPRARRFFEQLVDAGSDFRFGKGYLMDCTVGVIGFGDSMWSKKTFCTPAKKSHTNLVKLGAKNCQLVTVDSGKLEDSSIEGKVLSFVEKMMQPLVENKVKSTKKIAINQDSMKKKDSTPSEKTDTSPANSPAKTDTSPAASTDVPVSDDTSSSKNGSKDECQQGTCECMSTTQHADDQSSEMESDDLLYDDDTSDEEAAANAGKSKKEMDDLEDFENCGSEMLTQRQRKNLEKEGYKIVGSHSAVKICRWTKHHLRGRGGCYKHTCYGIASLSCMEATPSLACANKCVFCWRHHKNPVGKEWMWKADSPEMIVSGWCELHAKMVKSLRGIPGVTPERFEMASKIRHCALSLVGEPIMYPHINRVLELLHEREISSFLVTNAQFPEQLKTLGPCTQLYSSIDAATKEELKAVDRPLNMDFWEKFLNSIDALRDVRFSRSVFRLTLVKNMNMQDSVAEAYARLIIRGEPDFIEIKGVTYNGDEGKDATKMTMRNVPYHEEVREYGLKIIDAINRLSKENIMEKENIMQAEGLETEIKTENPEAEKLLSTMQTARSLPSLSSTTSLESAVSQAVSNAVSTAVSNHNRVSNGDAVSSMTRPALKTIRNLEGNTVANIDGFPSLYDQYELACEHKHSLCILISHKKFKINNKWHTHINYDEFHRLIRTGEWKEKDSVSYALETPSWALSGAKEEGFDPKDKRHFRKKKAKTEETESERQ